MYRATTRLRLSRGAVPLTRPPLVPLRCLLPLTPSRREREPPARVHARDSTVVAALLGVGGTAIVLRYSVQPLAAWWARPRAAKRYKGGFEAEMTRREAALILGVRESAEKAKVMEAYKRMMMLNHPDLGGSAHISTKINEAKDMMIKGKR